MSVKFSNNAVTTLSAGISAGATSFTVASASTFPTLGASDWTYVSLTSEVVKVTAISGTTFTCDATSGAHAIGATVELRMTSEILNDVALGDDETLAAYNNTTAITGNAVDVFIYDTSKDSDGGAWRKRTQATSWYNETLNTATRGSRKDFPSVAVIVAEAQKVTIYDGDTPDLDMWMVVTPSNNGGSSGWYFSLSATTSISALNGVIAWGNYYTPSPGNNNGGLVFMEMITDRLGRYGNVVGLSGYSVNPVLLRNIAQDARNGELSAIVHAKVNDVAMTVLPNAPIDSATGLPIPTIALATNGGVSVIKDDGTVVDITGFAPDATMVAFTYDNRLITSSASKRLAIGNIPAADTIITTFTAYQENTTPAVNTIGTWFDKVIDTGGVIAGGSDNAASQDHLYLLKENLTTPAKGSVAYLTSNYNTGWMVGDIKGAWLADTDTTNVVGTELITNGTFGSALGAEWEVVSPATQTITSGELVLTTTDSGQGTNQSFTTVVGETYVLSADVRNGTASLTFLVATEQQGTFAPNLGYASTTSSTASQLSVTFTATQTTTWVYLRAGASGTHIFDNVSVKLADTDRSVNNNGLQVNGTITKTAVATGAELVGYSGFSASNYLEQPYNADLNFGTGDFSVMGWVKGATSMSTANIVSRCSSWTTGFQLYKNTTSGTPYAIFRVGSVVLSGTTGITDQWNHIVAVRKSGVSYVYKNGVLESSVAATADVSGSYVTQVGWSTTNPMLAQLHGIALLRISATAPTAAQIKEIYEAEKPLFQENAKCTLNGASNVVRCLAYDDSTELLHVGTSGGRSTFSGLRRVDETSTNTTEISAQGGMIIEETA